MKKLFLLAGFALLISPNLFALKKARGYFISANTGKKYEVTFLIPVPFLSSEPNCAIMQTEIFYLAEDDGKERKVLKPENVSEVSFTFKNKTTLMRSVYDNLSRNSKSEFIFLEVIVDGPVTLYNYYETNLTPITVNPYPTSPMGTPTGIPISTTGQGKVRKVVQNKGTELVRIRQLFFKKDVGDFFSDCPELVEKVQSGKLTKLEEIVKKYNEMCADPSPAR